MGNANLSEQIVGKYKVRVTMKPDKDISRKSLCGAKKNEDGRSFDIPAGLGDYYKTMLAKDFDISEPFLPEEKNKKSEKPLNVDEELEKILPTTEDFYVANAQIKKQPLKQGEYECWCGFKTDNYKKFDRHAYEHEEEKKKAERERRKAEGHKPFTKKAETKNDSGITFLERIPEDNVVDTVIGDEADNYVPTTMNAQSGGNPD